MHVMVAADGRDERTAQQRRDALQRANRVRTARARAKERLRAGADPRAMLVSGERFLDSWEVANFLTTLPKVGRAKARRILNAMHLSPTAHIGRLTQRQLGELAGRLP